MKKLKGISEGQMVKQYEYQEQFDYLEKLRESGRTNMFLAWQYLENEFDIDVTEAKKILIAWMASK